MDSEFIEHLRKMCEEALSDAYHNREWNFQYFEDVSKIVAEYDAEEYKNDPLYKGFFTDQEMKLK